MASVAVPGNMTRVERADLLLLPPGHLTPGTETIRRSRSLSELPGHHRVPILKRKDTERTQARLEAGDAGVKELRALRQQKQQLMEETLAQHKKSRVQTRQMTEIGDQSFHRPSEQLAGGPAGRQVYEPNIFSSMSWYSTNSLASITEEMGTRGQAIQPGIPYMAVNHARINPQRRGQKQSQSLRHESIIRYPQQTQRSVHSSQQGRTADAVDPKCQLLRGSHSMASLNTHHIAENHDAKSADRNLSTTRYSSSQTYLPKEQLKSGVQFMPNPTPSSLPISCNLDPDHRRSVVQLQSDQRFARGRTQSVHESFYYFPFPNKEAQKDHPFNGGRKSHESNDTNLALNTSRSKHDLSSDCEAGALGQQINRLSGTLTSFCNQSLHGDTTPASSPRNKSISWDELLVTIGLNKNLSDSNSTMENSNQGRCEAPETGHNTAFGSEQNSESSGVEIIMKKSGRSQSFTSGTFHNSDDCVQRVQKPNEHVSKFSHGHRPVSSQPKQRYIKLTPGHHSAAALSRRPSIQSEAVITRNDPLRKILNPLHEVDMKSMNVPGPLHAVTLQYCGLPGRKGSHSEFSPSTSSPEVNQGSNLSSTNIKLIMSEVAQKISSSHDHSSAAKELQSQNQASKKWDNKTSKDYNSPQANKATKEFIEPKQKHSSNENASQSLKHSTETTVPCDETQKTVSTTKVVKRSLFPNTKQSNSVGNDERSIENRSSSGVFANCVPEGRQNLTEDKANDDVEIVSHAMCATIVEENDDMLGGVKGQINLSHAYGGSSFEKTRDVKIANISTQNEHKVGSIRELSHNGNQISQMSSNKDRKLALGERSKGCNIVNLEVNVDSESVEQSVNIKQEMSNFKGSHSPHMSCDLYEHDPHRLTNEASAKNKLDNQSSCRSPSSPSRPLHTSDVNLFLDEGYNTCDSVSPKWQFNKHGLHSSDNSSMSSGSISNVSALGDGLFSPHEACSASKESNPSDVFRRSSVSSHTQVLAYSRNSSVFVTISEADSAALLESSSPDQSKTEMMTCKNNGIFTNTIENDLLSPCVPFELESSAGNHLSVKETVYTEVPCTDQDPCDSTSPKTGCGVTTVNETEKSMRTPVSPSFQSNQACLHKAGGPPKQPFKQTAV
ncbi:unnamed protein product [Lymnaea stagnalis]|uniref:Uncharacterized protein n=1 Tax=Lymnaea stagnalis TaxID=6523 RepID=A0AAV2IHI5_LYMST